MRFVFIVFLVVVLKGSIISQTQTTWEIINPPLTPATPYSFLMKSDGTIFIGTEHKGVFRSTDDGKTWQLHNQGLSSDINCFAEDVNGWIYGGTGGDLNYSLFRSLNNGESWEPLLIDGAMVYTINITSTGHILVGCASGMYISKDNGDSWFHSKSGLTDNNVLSIISISDTVIIVATNDGVHKTTNGGDSWTPINNGLTKWGKYYRSNKLILKADTLYVSCYGGLYYSTNLGDQWIQKSRMDWGNNLLIDNNNVFYLYQESVACLLLRSFNYGITWDTVYTFPGHCSYLGTKDGSIFASFPGQGLYVSTDSAKTFERYFVEPFIQSAITSFKIVNTNLWLAGTSGGMFSSTNSGQAWKNIGPSNSTIYSIHVNSNNEIFTNCGYHLYKSTDDGTTWEFIPDPPFSRYLRSICFSGSNELYASYTEYVVKLNNDFTWDSIAYFKGADVYDGIFSIIVDKYNDAYLSVYSHDFWGSYFHTYRSYNNFGNFQTILSTGCKLACNDSGYVFFCTSNKIYRTRDRGTTIEEINNGLTSLYSYPIIAIDFNEIYVGDSKKIYISTNNGNIWQSIPGPTGGEGIHSIEKISNGFLVVATKNGIYKNTTAVSVEDIENKGTTPSVFLILQNYPNPFNPETTINYTLPESGMVQVKIFDVLGRELKTLVNEFSASGLHSVKWDGSNYSSGIYFCSITFNGKTLNNKMLLMK